MGGTFITQNSLIWTWSLPTEEIFQVHGQNRLVANLLADDFRSQPREMPLSKLLNTQLSVFSFFHFGFLPLERHCLEEIRIFQCLIPTNDLGLGMV